MDRPLGRGKKCKDICVPCECAPKGLLKSSAEEDFNNQADSMIHPVGTSWLLSQAILSLPIGLMNKVVMVAGTQVIRGLSISVS